MIQEAPKLTDAQKAYGAAIIDACGDVYVRRYMHGGETVVRREIVLRLHGLGRGAAEFFMEHFEGAVVFAKREPSAGVRPRTTISVEFATRRAATVLAMVMDYLRDKEPQARLVFRFSDTARGRGAAPSEEDQRVRREVEIELEALRKGA